MSTKSPSKNEVSELISFYYRIEQLAGNFSHVIEFANQINVDAIEKERKRLEDLYDSWEQGQRTVVETNGHFAMVGNSIAFVGSVITENENGERKVSTGEHGKNDYDWNGFWTEE